MEPEWSHLFWNAPNLMGVVTFPERASEFISDKHDLSSAEVVYLNYFKHTIFKETSQYNLISGEGIKPLLKGKSPGAVSNIYCFSTVHYYLHLFSR